MEDTMPYKGGFTLNAGARLNGTKLREEENRLAEMDAAKKGFADAETAGGNENAYAAQASDLRKSGSPAAADALDAHIAKMDSAKRKRALELAEASAGPAWGFIENHTRYFKDSGDLEDANKKAVDDYGKAYYNADPELRKFWPSPEKMNLGMAHMLAGQSKSVINALTSRANTEERQSSKDPEWADFEKAPENSKLSLTEKREKWYKLKSLQYGGRSPKGRDKSLSEKDVMEYKKQNAETLAARQYFYDKDMNDKDIAELYEADKNNKIAATAIRQIVNIPGVAIQENKTPKTISSSNERIQVKGPDGKIYTIPNTEKQRALAKSKGYTEVK